MEAEGAERAEGAEGPLAEGATDRLCRVLDHRHVATELQQRGQVAGVAGVVDRDDRARAGSDRVGGLLDVEIPVRIDVDEDELRAAQREGGRGGYEGKGGQDDFVIRSHVEQQRRCLERVCAGAHEQGALRELRLEQALTAASEGASTRNVAVDVDRLGDAFALAAQPHGLVERNHGRRSLVPRRTLRQIMHHSRPMRARDPAEAPARCARSRAALAHLGSEGVAAPEPSRVAVHPARAAVLYTARSSGDGPGPWRGARAGRVRVASQAAELACPGPS